MQQTLFSLSILFHGCIFQIDGYCYNNTSPKQDIVSTYQINLVSTYKIFITIELYYVYFNYKKLGLESVYLCLFTTLCEQRIYFSRGGILRK